MSANKLFTSKEEEEEDIKWQVVSKIQAFSHVDFRIPIVGVVVHFRPLIGYNYFSSTSAQKCKVIYERDPKSHVRYITFAVPTHKGQPQHRELYVLLFSNSVWALERPILNL